MSLSKLLQTKNIINNSLSQGVEPFSVSGRQQIYNTMIMAGVANNQEDAEFKYSAAVHGDIELRKHILASSKDPIVGNLNG